MVQSKYPTPQWPSTSGCIARRMRKVFSKAFSDQSEHITSGMSPLRTIMKEFQLRTVHIYPR